MVLKIDVGCGANCKEGYEGIDYAKYTDDVKYIADLNKDKLPFKDNSVDAAYCCHVLEHMENPMDLVKEIHRVLKPGSELIIRVPHYSYPASHVMNHKNYWSFHCQQHFNGDYHEYTKWSNVTFIGKFVNPNGLRQRFFGMFLRKHPFAYETYLSNFFPIAEIEITLIK